jgi:hypothetical protein
VTLRHEGYRLSDWSLACRALLTGISQVSRHLRLSVSVGRGPLSLRVYAYSMRLLSLDYDPVYGDNATRSCFSYQDSAFDYDVVIWDPSKSLSTYGLDWLYSTHTQRLAEGSSIQIKADIKRRHDEFAEFLNLGRTLIIIASPSQQVRLYMSETVDLLTAIPFNKSRFTGARGTRIDFTGDGPIVDVLRKYDNLIQYSAVITDPSGVPYARIQGTDRIVGSIQRFESDGHLILMPFINLSAPDNEEADDEPDEDAPDDDPWLPEAEQFQTDLLAAVEQLGGSSSVSRPLWADGYTTKEQARLRADVLRRQRQVEKARSELAQAQQKKESAEQRNQLFLGSGRTLELEVRKALELLGGEVTEPPAGRDDWKVSFPEGRVVCEVKGVSKSAAERHAAQLEKWVASDYAETEELPKGLLVVNTWRDIPLEDRIEADFPDQMIPYSVKCGHCLMTGLQLFVILADIEANPHRAAHWRNLIMATSGVIPDCNDWRSVLSAPK